MFERGQATCCWIQSGGVALIACALQHSVVFASLSRVYVYSLLVVRMVMRMSEDVSVSFSTFLSPCSSLLVRASVMGRDQCVASVS